MHFKNIRKLFRHGLGEVAADNFYGLELTPECRLICADNHVVLYALISTRGWPLKTWQAIRYSVSENMNQYISDLRIGAFKIPVEDLINQYAWDYIEAYKKKLALTETNVTNMQLHKELTEIQDRIGFNLMQVVGT